MSDLVINPYSFGGPAINGSFRTVASFVGANGAASATITQADFGATKPQGGDLLVCFLWASYDSKSGSPSALPSGFTQVTSAGSQSIGIKTAGGSSGSDTTDGSYVSGTGTNEYGLNMDIIAVSGVTQTDVASISGYNSSGSATTDPVLAAPSVNATVAGFAVCWFYWQASNSAVTSCSADAPLILRQDIKARTEANNYNRIAIATHQLTSSGSTGTLTARLNAQPNSSGRSSATIVLR